MTLPVFKLSLPAAALALVAMASPAVANQLIGQQFIDTHVGKCLTYTGPTTGTQCYNADGTTAYEDTTYGSDTGIWIIRGDDVCVRYTSEPALDCGPVNSLGNGKYTDGSYIWTTN